MSSSKCAKFVTFGEIVDMTTGEDGVSKVSVAFNGGSFRCDVPPDRLEEVKKRIASDTPSHARVTGSVAASLNTGAVSFKPVEWEFATPTAEELESGLQVLVEGQAVDLNQYTSRQGSRKGQVVSQVTVQFFGGQLQFDVTQQQYSTLKKGERYRVLCNAVVDSVQAFGGGREFRYKLEPFEFQSLMSSPAPSSAPKKSASAA
ncbi:MAG: hypothetical protein ACRC46_01285 [Thermoguttaceae bacterium]